MDLKEKLVDFFINIVGLSELDANIYADVFIESGIKETNQFSEECGKCVSARLENGETTDPSHWRALPQTNADRIRAMSDEELAELFQSIIHEGDVTMIEKLKNQGIEASLVEAPVLSVKAHLEWLKQPAE